MVNWRARVMTEDYSVSEGIIRELLLDGLVIKFATALPKGSPVNIEFYVHYRNENVRIRVKTVVVYCMLYSNNEGAELELAMTQISREEKHVLGNVMQIFENSPEFTLRKE